MGTVELNMEQLAHRQDVAPCGKSYGYRDVDVVQFAGQCIVGEDSKLVYNTRTTEWGQESGTQNKKMKQTQYSIGKRAWLDNEYGGKKALSKLHAKNLS